MKKYLLSFIFLVLCLILYKYYFGNYKLQYTIDNHNILIHYKNRRTYYEIDSIYNFDIYGKRNFNKDKIISIKEINDDNFVCLYPIINDIKTYPLCKQDDIINYTLIDSELLDEYKVKNSYKDNNSTFNYYETLSDDTYIALWNYKGYYIMNGNNYFYKELFDNDRYDNSLSYMINNNIYMPNYSQDHTFNEIYVLDIISEKLDKFSIDYEIDYDSYVVGNINDKLYIFDNKYGILYEIDTKKKKCTIKASNEKGYVKYVNGKFETCSKSEYKVNKITYNINNTKYIYTNNEKYVYKSMKDNKSIKTIIVLNDINIIKELNSDLYYISDKYLYKYNDNNGSIKIFSYDELSFNDGNTIFIYKK